MLCLLISHGVLPQSVWLLPIWISRNLIGNTATDTQPTACELSRLSLRMDSASSPLNNAFRMKLALMKTALGD
ncbi:Uncharacterised protein [Serratia liquefaciens]|nr:Uncharacterised protein [Serratia liquefaciens]